MAKFTDQTGYNFFLDYPPKRIVSLVPSQTELLHALDLDQEVVGITRFCVHPKEWHRTKTRIGGTKGVHIDQLLALHPDLVIANKEENLKEEIEQIREKTAVYTSDINDLPDALEMIGELGKITGKTEKANSLANAIGEGFASLRPAASNLSVAYLIWKNPYMTVGRDCFISDMLSRCGFNPVFNHLTRYPQLTEAALTAARPDLVFLSSEPYPFKEIHQKELESLLPGTRIMLVDGEFFSWYGSRLLYAPSYFQKLIDQLTANP